MSGYLGAALGTDLSAAPLEGVSTPRVEQSADGVGAVQRKPAGEDQEPALPEDVEAQVRALLELPVAPGDARAAAAKRSRLVQLFRGLDARSRQALASRLGRRGDSLGALFAYRLATGTRNALLAALNAPAATEPAADETSQSEEGVRPDAVADADDGTSHETTTGSRGAGRASRSGSRGDPAWSHLIGEASTPVGKFARVKVPRGLRLRTEPHAGAETIAIMPLDTLVRVERKTEHGWAYAIALGDANDGDAVTGEGYCELDFLMLDPPEPAAHLHYVQGELPKDIAARYYKGGGFDWGADARLFVEAIWQANKDRTRGVYRDDVDLSLWDTAFRGAAVEQTLRVWKSIGVRDGHAIWIPSRAFVAQLKAQGAISSGSISYEAWEAAKGAVDELIDWAKYGAGFVVGLLEGAYGSVRDLVMGVVDLVEMIYDIVKAVIQEGFIDACKSFGEKIVNFFKNAPDTLQSLGAWFADKWTAKDAWDRGTFQGEVIGYVAMTIVLTILTMGAGIAAQAGGKFAQVIKVIRALDAAGDITAYGGKLKRVIRIPDGVKNAVRGEGKTPSPLRLPSSDSDDDLIRAVSANKPMMATASVSLDGRRFTMDFRRDLSGRAQGLVRKLEKQGFVRLESIDPQDLIAISKWFNREIGVLQTPYGKLRLVLGTETGVLKSQIDPGEIFVLHTHPVFRSAAEHFTLDLRNAGRHTEGVIDFSGQLILFSKSGIVNEIDPRTGAIRDLPRETHVAFLDSVGNVAGYASVKIVSSDEGTIIKVVK